jgi:hypothetical protein
MSTLQYAYNKGQVTTISLILRSSLWMYSPVRYYKFRKHLASPMKPKQHNVYLFLIQDHYYDAKLTGRT